VNHPVLLAAGAAATTQAIAFWALAVVAVAAALGIVLARKAVHCAVLLAVVMLTLAILYATQGAPFLAFVQVIVYTGAVLMIFLFVLMIVGVTSADSVIETIRGQRLAAGVAGIGLLVLLSLIVGQAAIGPAATAGPNFGSANIGGIAALIFTRYVFPFEVTSALLITAALGAMVLAHRERTSPKLTQRELSIRRMASGRPAPLPGPGTYARHNAVDMPALLPDGTPSRLSVSPVMAGRAGADPVLIGRAEAANALAGQAEPAAAVAGDAEPGAGVAGAAELGTAGEPGAGVGGAAGAGAGPADQGAAPSGRAWSAPDGSAPPASAPPASAPPASAPPASAPPGSADAPGTSLTDTPPPGEAADNGHEEERW
jgi:NADH-quinone oxidoreductase subunit J